MGYNQPNTYALNLGYTTTNPLDSSTYYFGNRVQSGMGTTATYYRVYIPRGGFIRAGILYTIATTTVGTNENIVMAIRVNNTTDYTFATVGSASESRIFSNYSLNIPVNTGDYIEIKVTTPAWATNPEGFFGWGNILIETW